VEVSVDVDGLLSVVEVGQGHKCLVEDVKTKSEIDNLFETFLFSHLFVTQWKDA